MENQAGYAKKGNNLAVGYTRVSTREQADSRLSLEAQEREIREYCCRNRLDLVSLISDPGESGKDLDRSGVQGLIKRCNAGAVSHVVVWDTSRLTRSTRDLLNVVYDVFDHNDIKFHSISQSIDTRTSMGRLHLTMLGAIDQYYRDQISENTIKALRQKKIRGEPVGAPPFGYESTAGGFYKKNEAEMKAIKRIRRLRSAGNTFRDIARILNQANIPAKSGGYWYAATVRHILNNRNYWRLSRQRCGKKACF